MLDADKPDADVLFLRPFHNVSGHLVNVSFRNHPEAQRKKVRCHGIVGIASLSVIEEFPVECILYHCSIMPETCCILLMTGNLCKIRKQAGKEIEMGCGEKCTVCNARRVLRVYHFQTFRRHAPVSEFVPRDNPVFHIVMTDMFIPAFHRWIMLYNRPGITILPIKHIRCRKICRRPCHIIREDIPIIRCYGRNASGAFLYGFNVIKPLCIQKMVAEKE